jgi:3-oxoacyl-[acyl-carrier protein] reductase
MTGLAGKTAFVSGSGKNIGRAIALDLAARGANVVVNGASDTAAAESVAEAARGHGVEALVAMGDIGKREAVTEIAEAALARFGTVDILVNNAAIRPSTPFLEMAEEDWHHVLDVDLHSAFYTCRAFLPGMIGKGWGRIVNITGMNAIAGYPGRTPASVAKHGLWALTKSLAKEFGPNGVTVNAVSPGPIRGEHKDPEITKRIEARAAQVPVGRIGEPEDIAALTGFLCSEEGGFVSGQMIGSNGGMQT